MINDLLVYKKYIGPWFEIGMVIRSPLPSRNENNPSWSVKLYNDGKLRWKDFNYESPYGHDIIAFVAEMEPSVHSRDEAYALIKGDSIIGATRSIRYHDKLKMIKVPISYNAMKLKEHHLEYFEQLLVSEELLDFYNIRGLESIQRLNRVYYKDNDVDFGFHYTIGNGQKTYRPFAVEKKDKFRGHGVDVLEGYEQLPRNEDCLILTKSLKDAVYLRGIGVIAISCGSENSFNIIAEFAPELNARFKNIFRWGDPDLAGKKYAAQLLKFFPNSGEIISEMAKDPTDIQILTRNPYYNLKLIKNVYPEWRAFTA